MSNHKPAPKDNTLAYLGVVFMIIAIVAVFATTPEQRYAHKIKAQQEAHGIDPKLKRLQDSLFNDYLSKQSH
jgi:hypothetical protein